MLVSSRAASSNIAASVFSPPNVVVLTRHGVRSGIEVGHEEAFTEKKKTKTTEKRENVKGQPADQLPVRPTERVAGVA